jgi:hypothetical protein
MTAMRTPNILLPLRVISQYEQSSETECRVLTGPGQSVFRTYSPGSNPCRPKWRRFLAALTAILGQGTERADRIGSKTFRERDVAANRKTVLLEIGVPFVAGTYDERMYEELRLRAQTFEVLTGGDFAADHADGQDDTSECKESGLSAVRLPPEMINDLRLKLHVWASPESPETWLGSAIPALAGAAVLAK